jgi:hypothetical protein
MNPIKANFMIVNIDEDHWDVLIFAEQSVLKAFIQTYPNLFYVEKSVFNDSPMVVVPDFPKKNHAEAWKEYWELAFAEPDKSCSTCPVVQELFRFIEAHTKGGKQ